MKSIFTLMGLVVFSALLCQEPIFRSFSFEQGLRTYNIKKTLQDKYGYLWIATQYGVYRYNGKSFDVFTKNGNVAGHLSENFIFDMFYTPENDLLYTASFNGGVDVVNVRTLSVKKLFANSRPNNIGIWKLLVDHTGKIWVASENYLAVYGKSAGDGIGTAKPLFYKKDIRVSCMRQVNDSTVAIGTGDSGVFFYDIKCLPYKTVYALEKKNPFIGINIQDVQVSGKYIFVVLPNMIYRTFLTGAKIDVIEKFTPFAGNKAGVISCIVPVSDTSIWIGTNIGIVLLNTKKKQYRWIRKEEKSQGWLEDNTVNNLFLDREHNMWVSTSKKLHLIKLRPEPFKIFSRSSRGKTQMGHLFSLVSDGKGLIYATGTDGLYIVNLASSEVRKVNGSASLGVVHNIFKLNDLLFLISSDHGMFIYDSKDGKISREMLIKKYPEWTSYADRYFNNTITRGNKVFLASEEQEGLFIWDKNAHTIVQQKAGRANGIPENHLHNIKEDKKGNLWLMMDNSVARYNASTLSVEEVIWHKPDSSSFNSGIFFDMFDDGQRLWFGTYSGGLNGYDPIHKTWEYITEEDGLCNNCIYGILPERDSIVWVATNFGISRVNYRTRTCLNFFKEDGLQDNSFDEMGVLKLKDSLFFGGINGFTLINTKDYVYKAGKLPFYIDGVSYEAKGQTNTLRELDWQKLMLPAETTSIEIHFSSPQYSYNNVRFQYRVSGMGSVFQSVGEDNIVKINFLPQGDHQFELRVLDKNGRDFASSISLPFYIHPHWYNTWWIKVIAILMVGVIAYMFYRLKLNRLLREQRIRQEISSDLHDDLGSTLNSAKIFAELAMQPGADTEYLANIKHNLSDASLNLRDIIWVLDDKQDTVANLAERLKKFCFPIVTPLNIGLHIEVDKDIQSKMLSKRKKRNLFMIFKEACNNSFKYASCSNIFIRFFAEDGQLKLEFRDDGAGFAPDEVVSGYGLKNMIFRAESIGYKAEIVSSSGSGVVITLTNNSHVKRGGK